VNGAESGRIAGSRPPGSAVKVRGKLAAFFAESTAPGLPPSEKDALKERQAEILRLVAIGLTYDEVPNSSASASEPCAAR